MRNYESLYIIHPEVVGDDLTAMVEKFQGVLTAQGAEIHKLDNWGVRRLAYQIKKVERGCYVQTLFRAEPQVIAELERRMRLDEKVLRFLTVRHEGEFAPIEAAAAVEVQEAVSAEEVSAEKVSAEKVSAEKVSAEKVSAEKVSAEKE